jgi:hypothetical protein
MKIPLLESLVPVRREVQPRCESRGISLTLRLEAIFFSETSVLKTTTRCHNPEESILRCYRRENIKSLIFRSSISHETIVEYSMTSGL